jgi:glutamate synthase (NADPH) large chain
VELSPVEDRADVQEVTGADQQPLALFTQSSLAAGILTNWDEFLPKFVKVIPLEYKKVLEMQKIRELERKLQMAEEDPTRHE